LYTNNQKKFRENHGLSIKIEPLSTDSPGRWPSGPRLRDFLALPYRLYATDPNWVPPLLFTKKQQLAEKHAYFRHARWEGFLALKEGRPVGRISAQIDDLEAAQGRGHLGHFGLLEAEDDPAIFAALLAAAEAWLGERGRTELVGPFNLNINQELGVLVEGFDTPPFFMMGHARPYYGPHIEAAGYQVAKGLLAYEIDPTFEVPPVTARLVRRLQDRLVVRPLDARRRDEDLATICALFNDAWANNWGFLPFTEAEFLTIGREMLAIIDPDFIQIAEVDGEPAAFIVLLPNVNEAIRDLRGRLLPFGWLKLLWRLKVRYPGTGRVPLMGVRQAYQRTRLGPGLAFAVIDAVRGPARRRGLTRVELSWILEDNAGMRHIIETISGEPSKRYHLYRKALPARG